MYVIKLAKDSYKLDEPACHPIALCPWNTQMKKDSYKLSQKVSAPCLMGFSISLLDQLIEGTGVSKEYTGDQGRYLPPKAGRPVSQHQRGDTPT